MQKNVVVLTASFGNGHNAAMEAIIEALLAKEPTLTIEKADIYDIATPKQKTRLSQSYDFLTRTPLPIYNPLYTLRNGKHLRIDDIMVALYFHRFEKMMLQWKPNLIISVFPTGAEFAAKYKQQCDPNVFLCTIITDVVASWEWIHPPTDFYGLPTDSIRSAMLEKGVESDKLFVTGIPVRCEVKCPSTHEKTFTNSKGFKSQTPHILMIGSAMGRLAISEDLLEFMAKSPAIFEIVTGKDKALFDHLQELSIPDNVTVTGFVADLQHRMEQSDVIITKPGGATLFEALAHEVPLIAYKSTIAQEGHNAKFIESHGLGVCYRSESQLIEKISWILENPDELQNMKTSMQYIKSQIDLEDLVTVLVEHSVCLKNITNETSHHALEQNDGSLESIDGDLEHKDEEIKRKKLTFNWLEKEYVNEIRNLSKAFKARGIANRK